MHATRDWSVVNASSAVDAVAKIVTTGAPAAMT